MDDGAITKKVLKSLHTYLQDNLPASKDFISGLYGKNLLAKANMDQLVALADKGDKQSCTHRLLDYMSLYYVDKTLEDFCAFLEEDSEHAKPILYTIAKTIRKEIKTQQTTLMQQQHDQQHHQDDIPGPSGLDTPTTPSPVPISKSVEPTTMSAAVSADGGDVVYPVIVELEDDFAELASEVLTVIKSLNKAALEKLCFYLGSLLRPKNPPSSPPPNVPESADKLVDFLRMRWDELNIRVMRSVVGHLKVENLTKQMKDYEQKLSKEIISFLSECEKRKVSYKKDACHSSIAVTIDGTPDEVSLARILQLQDFFVMKLGLGEALFKGFKTGSTILFFSIPEDSVWCLPMCLHPSNLPQLEEWKVVSLSVEGSFTVDIIESRVFDVVNMESLSKKDHLIGDLKAKVSLWKGKVYVLEDILSHHKEVPFEGEKYSSQHPTLVKGKSEPLSKASKPGDVPESEPWTMKPKLEGPDYPDVKTKLETKSEVEATHSEIRIKSEVETMGSALGPGPHPELETVESALRPGTHPELETVESAPRLVTHTELETVESALGPGPHPEVQDTPPEPHSDVKGKGKKLPTSHDVLSTQSTPSSLVTQGPPHHSMHSMAPQFLSPHEPTHWPLGSDPPRLIGLSSLQQMGPGPFFQMGPGPSHSMGTGPSSLFSSTPVQREPLEPLHPTRTGEVTSSKLALERIQRLRETEENIHKLILFEEEKLKLTLLYWGKQPNVLVEMLWPTAVYLNDKIFVGDRRWRDGWWWSYHQFLYVFNVVSQTWSKVPFHDSCEMYGFTLATTANQVHTLGGGWRKDEKEKEYSKVVFSLDDNMKWSNTLPPLNIGRRYATSTSFEDMIVVAGGLGRNGGDLSSVEVLDSSQPSSTWWEICDLPVKSWLMQCTVTDNELFIGCGYGTDNTVYTAKLSAVKESLIPSDPKSSVSPESFWESLPETPLEWSGLVAVNNCLVTVGGRDDVKHHSSSVDLYDCYKKTWTKVSDIRMSRVFPAVVVCTIENKQELFVLCGSGAVIFVESCEV